MRLAAIAFSCLAFTGVMLLTHSAASPTDDPRLRKASRVDGPNGWIRVRLEGTPAQIGYQHGFLLAREIGDIRKVAELELTHDSTRDWEFFRKAATEILWPRIDEEYRAELKGIAEGATAAGVKIDAPDITVINAMIEFGYYTAWLDKKKNPAAKSGAQERCSAFVATGRYTRDGRIVIAHNNWTAYLDGSRWNVIFDIRPARGHRMLMDGMAGLIHSGDDFGVNSAGLAITETTISNFHGFDPKGVPEFVRARKAMQYASSIDEFVAIMKEGNNGGYANNWLVADTKTNEIADLELGLKNVNLRRTKDGYFVGTNFPVDPKLTREETDFKADDMGSSANARRVRATQMVEENKGRIDLAFARRYLSDHYDSFEKKESPGERSLCGHVELSPRGIPPWQPPFGPAGTAQSKVADHAMAVAMSFEGAIGHACGRAFNANEHLAKHPEFRWQSGLLRDLPSQPWTPFAATN